MGVSMVRVSSFPLQSLSLYAPFRVILQTSYGPLPIGSKLPPSRGMTLRRCCCGRPWSPVLKLVPGPRSCLLPKLHRSLSVTLP
ncbi:hypothetical protein Tco_0313593 [Tanacetum coccineum]